MSTSANYLDAAHDFLEFVNGSPTPFHAVQQTKERLEKAGFEQIRERDPWTSRLKPNGKYYLTRNSSTLVAFAIGGAWKPGNPIGMVGAHTDSCCLRVKPVSKKQSDGFLQVGVETYGGGLWHTWFDRDLSAAGRVMVREQSGHIVQRLANLKKPILRVPSLAVHLDRQDPFSFNKEAQLFPIAGLAAAELNRQAKQEKKDEQTNSQGPLKPQSQRHHIKLIELIAQDLGVSPEQILDFEMLLYDTQKSCIGGINDELIFSARLDNLMMSYTAIEALIGSVKNPSGSLDKDSTIRVAALFDDEEIGSTTAQGADSQMLPGIIRRLCLIPAAGSSSPPTTASSESASSSTGSYNVVPLHEDNSTAYEQTLSSSYLISADMTHAVHPNYPGNYESEHRPEINKGVTIKINANQRYATNSPGIVMLEEIARRAKTPPYYAAYTNEETTSGVPLQLFVVKNDSPCGSTIGPILSAGLGTRTIDVGLPQLSMHSIRETGGAYDVGLGVALFESFFEHFADVESKVTSMSE